MEQIIYVKYSNERSRQFALRTEILEDELGKRSVKKTAMHPEGQVHLKGIRRKYLELSKELNQSVIEYNRCEEDNDGIRFEYIEAQTLEERLDKLLEEKKVTQAVQILKNYLLMIDNLNNQEQFYVTDIFKEIFGDVSLPEDLYCGTITNIDMVCGNVLLKKNRWIMIDYEWTFTFPIPVHYLLYRIIHYYQDTHSSRKNLKEFELYSWAGLKEEECITYAIMEQNFQKYITQRHVPMREMYADISPGIYPVSHLVSKEELKRTQERIQIFYSFGKGFHQQDSEYYPMENGYIYLEVDLPPKTEEIRIDPGEGIGICKVRKLCYDAGKIQHITVSEGIEENGDTFFMSRPDPQIYLGKVPEYANRLILEMEVVIADADSIEISEANNDYIQLLKRYYSIQQQENIKIKKELEKIRQEYEQTKLLLQQRDENLTEIEGKISQMENTKIWKAYRKYRKVRERI